MKVCVVFAASVYEASKLYVLEEFCSVFRCFFSDAEFVVGINYGSLPWVEKAFKGLNCRFCRIKSGQRYLYTWSDASAFQAALWLLKLGHAHHDLYWFCHTKGGVNRRDTVRRLYLDEVFKKRESIEAMFVRHPRVGSWGLRGVSVSASGTNWADYNVDCCIPICENVKSDRFPASHVNWSYIDTMFVLHKSPMETYLQSVPVSFFVSRLDSWYFETVMPWTASRCGYFPYVRDPLDYFGRCDLRHVTRAWINENALPFEDYLNLETGASGFSRVKQESGLNEDGISFSNVAHTFRRGQVPSRGEHSARRPRNPQ